MDEPLKARIAYPDDYIQEDSSWPYNDSLLKTKQMLGLALQIGSAFIPVGGGLALGAKLGTKVLAPLFGQAIGRTVGQGLVSGGLSGLTEGIGRGLYEDKNPLLTGLQDSVTGGLTIGGVGRSAGAIERQKAIKKLKNAGTDRFHLSNQFYSNYERGLDPVVDKLGKVRLSSDGYRETNKQSPQYYDEVVDLHNKLKKAKYYHPEEPKHNHKYNIKTFHRLNGDNVDYLISENDKGNYYFYKTTYPTKADTQSEGLGMSNNIITDLARNLKTKLFDYLIKK